MSPATLALPLFLLVLVTLLLWIAIGGRGRWGIKLAMIIVVPAGTLMVWRSLDTYLGWPSPNELPERFIITGMYVREPDPKTGDAGAIYLWVRVPGARTAQLLGYRLDAREPRAYRLPYDRNLHEQIAQFQRALLSGAMIGGVSRRGHLMGQPGDGQRGGQRPGGGGEDGNGRPRGQVELYELPPAQQPDKTPMQ